jgi:16S rRNA (uracil1498-N3)-methyltransferase
VAVAHVFVADLDVLDLDDVDRHHLSRSLRLRPGEEVTASDGAGRWRRCRSVTARSGGGPADLLLEADGPVRYEAAPSPPVGVGFVVTKGERPEWVVQKLTEVGVDRIVLLSSARSVVRWEAVRAERNTERLRRVAREAAMQSRRTRLPEVSGPAPLGEVVSRSQDAGEIALAEQGGERPTLARPFVLVGPEGGWDPAELAGGLPRVGLGPNVLRAETAAVTAGVLLCGLRAGLVS